MKRVTLRAPNEDEVIFIGESSNHLSNVISAAIVRKMVRKGCEAYLAYVIDIVKARTSVSDIPTLSDFPDVFLDEFPALPPQREIEFAIDVVPGATPASVTQYRIAPQELKELKLQLQELLKKKGGGGGGRLFDQVYHHGELPCFLSRRKMVHLGYV